MATLRILLALAAITLAGCASAPAKNPADPLEPFNRGMYRFNDTLDKAIAKPVAQGYKAAMPTPVQMMVSNFFSNMDDAVITINDLLQFKFAQAASDGARFLFNSTFGVLGLFDVAHRLEKHNEDFGQTLGYWGVGSGPYIVLPIFGPSTLRDGAGTLLDSGPSKLRRVHHTRTRNQLYLTKAIDHRTKLLDQEKVLDEAAIDRYAFIREAYLLRRQSLVYDGNPPRREYEDYEEENGFEYQEAPIPNVPFSQQDNVPLLPLPVDEPQIAAAAPETGAESLGVYRVWVAQRGGKR